ncbi:hypothetical protein GCM10011512_29570 [Tersicoccus solisilvae]|uniref:Integral membrane protein n=1 Tax=Tersicoccus solisilvae TaxID=1882339 RepID=A0ABQ1PPF1_9MICC|nr:hypothetical protein [Tersicoccus solisilvae]GGD00809.1 hypothetical protein GCM10011512_29570 [Tersicoccus solisilvae]
MSVLFWLTTVVGLISTAVCLVEGIRGRIPDNLTVFSVLAVEVVLLVVVVAALIGSVTGAGPRGAAWEFWGYLVTAALIPPAAVYWSLIERTRWSTLVLAAVGFTVFVMMARMLQIWEGQAGL